MNVGTPGPAGNPAAVPDVWDEAAGPGRRQVLFDVAAAAGFGLVAGVVQLQQSGWAVASAVLLALALAIRRLRLPGMVVLALAGAVAQVATSDVGVLGDLAYAPICFTLGAHRSARVRRLGLVCAGLAVVVAGAWAAANRLADNGSGLSAAGAGVAIAAMAAVVAGGGWVTGYLRWQRRQAIQSKVNAGLQQAEQRRLLDLVQQEQDRARIAADMHDVVAHSWAVVAAQADGARYLLRADPDQAEAALSVIGETARSAMTDVRRLLTELREGEADTATLGVERTDELVAKMRESGMDLVVRRTGRPTDDGLAGLTAGRLLAEALTNALKHGDLSRPVMVEEQWQDGYRLRVENAVDHTAGGGVGGHGLLGISERVDLAGGTLSAGQEQGRWVVQVAIPAGSGRSEQSPGSER